MQGEISEEKEERSCNMRENEKIRSKVRGDRG